MCDDGCDVYLNKRLIQVFLRNKKILQGFRNYNDGLWDFTLPIRQRVPTTKQSISVIIPKHNAPSDLVRFFHGACFSPSGSTFLKAVRNGNFQSWPGLTPDLISKYLQPTIATHFGHLNQERQYLQTTKPSLQADDDFFPSSEPNNTKTHEMMAALVPYCLTKKAYGDLPGKFPFTSTRGAQYFLVVYDYDSNAILVETLRNRTGPEIKRGYLKIYSLLKDRGCAPTTFILDNEISTILLNAFEKEQLAYQLVPPHNHRRNAAERAIQTWKENFIAGLCSVHPDFPMLEWDRLTFQGMMTLNFLRNSRVNPKLSAWEYLFGRFDYNKTPLAPPGMKLVIHNKPSQRRSWDPHGLLAFYVGPAMQHYRCMRCYVPATKAERVTDTVTYLPHNIPLPHATPDIYIQKTLDDILNILKDHTRPSPVLHPETPIKAIIQLEKILKPNSSTDVNTHNPADNQYSALPPPVPQLPKPLQGYQAPLPRVPPTQSSQPLSHFRHHVQPLPYNATLPRVPQHFITARLSPPPSAILPPLKLPPVTQPWTMNHAHHINPTIWYPTIHHIYDANGRQQTIDHLRASPQKAVWERALSNEWGRLAQGNQFGVIAMDTIDFIPASEVPRDRKTTYASFVCDHRPLKTEPWRVRIVVGGDKLTYEDDTGSPAASLLESKLLFNSTISDARKGARFMSLDLKDFFLATPMQRPEYMRVPYKYFPSDIRKKYNLDLLVHDGYIYVRIKKGMYGLKQAAVLAYQNLINKLAPFGYEPIPHTDSFWRHKSRPTKFCLCVDDFGVKYFHKQDIQHLITALQQNYKISTDFEGTNYCGLTLDWFYDDGFVDVSMPGYVPRALEKFQHKAKTPQYSPHPCHRPAYGSKVQYAPDPDTTDLASPKEKQRVQSIAGTFL